MDKEWTGPWTIRQAAARLGVSEKTIRRYINTGKLEARQEDGQHGRQWVVTALPEQPDITEHTELSTKLFADILREKDNRIEELNQQLGAYKLRVGQLENEVKLLEAPKGGQRPWWRIWGRG